MTETPVEQGIAALSDEQIGSFRRAFCKPKAADFIIVDGWSPQWMRDDIVLAEKAGLITSEFRQGDQYSYFECRPTAEFRSQLEKLS